MKSTKTLFFATSIASLLGASAAHAVDYTYNNTQNFTLTATDQARGIGTGTSSGSAFNANDFGSVYDRGADRDTTYMHFNLSSLAGATINGTVNLNLTVDAYYGGAINNGVVGSASSAWSYPGNTPGITTISGANPSGNYSTGQTATAVLDNTTFQGFVTNPNTFNGLAITAGAGSTAHFAGPATLTGSVIAAAINVTGATDWSAAVFNAGTSTLSISGANDVSGGSVTVNSGATVAVTDSATLGSGSFSGGFSNAGTLSFGSSANQTLSGVISGSGVLAKSGAGTLTLSGANTYTDTTTISGGTLQIGNGGATGSLYSPVSNSGNLTFGSASSIVNNGALIYNIAGDSVNVNQTISGSGTVSVTGNQGVNFANGTTINTTGSQTYSATATGSRYNGFTLTDNASVALTSSAGNISMTGKLGTANGDSGSLAINTSAGNGNVTLNVAAGPSGVNYGLSSLNVNAGTGTISLGVFNGQGWGTVSTISLTGGAVNSTVNMGSFTTLTVNNSSSSLFSGTLSSSGTVTKSGAGTLTLANANTYTGGTSISAGTLKVTNGGALGSGSANVAIGSAGALTFDTSGGSYNQNATTITGTGTMNVTGGNRLVFGAGGVVNVNLSAGAQINLQSGYLDSSSSFNGIWINNQASLDVASGAVFGLKERQVVVDALTGGGTLSQDYPLSDGNTSSLVVGIANASGTFSGQIQNSASVLKTGSGTQTLSGANTYTGTTLVSGGKLVVNGNISTSSLTTVSVGATLGGSGTVGKTIINGTLAVGTSPGQMNFTNSLDLNGAAIMEIDGTSGAGVTGGHDFVNLTGGGAAGVLTYGGTMTLDMGVIFGIGTYSWNLFDMASETGTFTGITLSDQYSGTLFDADLNGVWDLTSGSNTWQFTESSGVLGLTVIPEPNVAALLSGLGVLTLLRRRRCV